MTKSKRLVTLLFVVGILHGMDGLVQADNVDPPEMPPLPPPVTIVDDWDPVTGVGTIEITADRPIVIGDPGINVKITANGGQVGNVVQIAIGVTYTVEIQTDPGPPPHIDIDIWSPSLPGQQ